MGFVTRHEIKEQDTISRSGLDIISRNGLVCICVPDLFENMMEAKNPLSKIHKNINTKSFLSMHGPQVKNPWVREIQEKRKEASLDMFGVVSDWYLITEYVFHSDRDIMLLASGRTDSGSKSLTLHQRTCRDFQHYHSRHGHGQVSRLLCNLIAYYVQWSW